MARLTGRTVVVHPDTRAVVVLEAGDDAPEWAEIGEHLLDKTDTAAPSKPEPKDIPTRHGAGSGKDAWAAYAAAKGVQVLDGATRDDIIAALDQAGIPTE